MISYILLSLFQLVFTEPKDIPLVTGTGTYVFVGENQEHDIIVEFSMNDEGKVIKAQVQIEEHSRAWLNPEPHFILDRKESVFSFYILDEGVPFWRLTVFAIPNTFLCEDTTAINWSCAFQSKLTVTDIRPESNFHLLRELALESSIEYYL